MTNYEIFEFILFFLFGLAGSFLLPFIVAIHTIVREKQKLDIHILVMNTFFGFILGLLFCGMVIHLVVNWPVSIPIISIVLFLRFVIVPLVIKTASYFEIKDTNNP